MKKLLISMILSSALSQAGVVKVATFPVRHPVKTSKGAFKGSVAAIKAVAKGAYNF